MELLVDKPGLYLDEMQWYIADQWNVFVSEVTISRHVREQKWSKKKMKLQARQRDELLRANWRYEIANLCAKQVVFCDESGTD